MSNNSEDNNLSNQMMEEDDDSKIFPQRLMEILSDECYHDSISWLPHGRAFVIKNRKLFGETVMPKYFSRKAKYSSFTRKLNRWYVLISPGWAAYRTVLCDRVKSLPLLTTHWKIYHDSSHLRIFFLIFLHRNFVRVSGGPELCLLPRVLPSETSACRPNVLQKRPFKLAMAPCRE
jgi:hypothetical protein